MRMRYLVMVVFGFLFPCAGADGVTVSAATANNPRRSVTVFVKIQSAVRIGQFCLYRSYYNLKTLEKLNLSDYPITKITLKPEKNSCTFVDSMVSDDCDYYYYAGVKINGELLPCNVAHVATGCATLRPPVNASPEILVDKKNYFLEIRYGGKAAKRYPVSLGRDPFGRKVQQDCLTTPEGRYEISYFKPQSAFHKALGVSYPTAADRARYERARRTGLLDSIDGAVPSIGGSIQIHGGGIGNNWTWGCMAMRNADIDELFRPHLLRVGTPLWIVGSEFTRDSIAGMK
jgi:hypothetical protein